LFTKDDPGLELGLQLLPLSLEFGKRECRQWPPYVPLPEASPRDEDDIAGNILFFGALCWIMRHELAHHTLKHFDLPAPLSEDKFAQEHGADSKATEWTKRSYEVDENREAGSLPSSTEMELERRATSVLVGVLWIASFECVSAWSKRNSSRGLGENTQGVRSIGLSRRQLLVRNSQQCRQSNDRSARELARRANIKSGGA
jgi:hypothetical protein